MGKEINIAFTSTAYGPLWAPAVASWLHVVAYASRYMAVTPLGLLGDVITERVKDQLSQKILGTGITDRQYTHAAENQLVADFLADERFTHLFMTEMDMILPPDAIVKLLELDKPVASGIYFLRHGNGQPCLFQKVLTSKENPYVHSPVTGFPLKEPFRVDNPGLGCVLFKREAFAQLVEPFFDLAAKKYGSDMYFFSKVKWAGVEVWAHPEVMCDQIDYKVETFKDYLERIKKESNYVASGVVIGASERDRCPSEVIN